MSTSSNHCINLVVVSMSERGHHLCVGFIQRIAAGSFLCNLVQAVGVNFVYMMSKKYYFVIYLMFEKDQN